MLATIVILRIALCVSILVNVAGKDPKILLIVLPSNLSNISDSFSPFYWRYLGLSRCPICLREHQQSSNLFFILFLFFKGEVAEGERILSKLHAQRRAQHGARSHNCEIMTWAETKSWLLNRQTSQFFFSHLVLFPFSIFFYHPLESFFKM